MAIKISDSAAGVKRYRGVPEQLTPERYFGQQTLDNRARQLPRVPDVASEQYKGDMAMAKAKGDAVQDVVRVAGTLAEEGVKRYNVLREADERNRIDEIELRSQEEQRTIEKETLSEKAKGNKSAQWYEDTVKHRTSTMWERNRAEVDARSDWGKRYFNDRAMVNRKGSQARAMDYTGELAVQESIKRSERQVDKKMWDARNTNDLVEVKRMEEDIRNLYIERAMMDPTMSPEMLDEQTRLAQQRAYDNFYDNQSDKSYEQAVQALQSFKMNVKPMTGLGDPDLDDMEDYMVQHVYTGEEYDLRIKKMTQMIAAHDRDDTVKVTRATKELKEARTATFDEMNWRITDGLNPPTYKEILDAKNLPEDDPSGITTPNATRLLAQIEEEVKLERTATVKEESFNDEKYQYNQNDQADLDAVQSHFKKFLEPAIKKQADESYSDDPMQHLSFRLKKHAEFYGSRGVLPTEEKENIERGLSQQAGEEQNIATMKYVRNLIDINPDMINNLPEEVQQRVNYIHASGDVEKADKVFDRKEALDPKRRAFLLKKSQDYNKELGESSFASIIDEKFDDNDFRSAADKQRAQSHFEILHEAHFLASDGDDKYARTSASDKMKSQWKSSKVFGGETIMQHSPESVLANQTGPNGENIGKPAKDTSKWIGQAYEDHVEQWQNDGIPLDGDRIQLKATMSATLEPADGIPKWIVTNENGYEYRDPRSGKPLYFTPRRSDYQEIADSKSFLEQATELIDRFGEDDRTVEEQNAAKGRAAGTYNKEGYRR